MSDPSATSSAEQRPAHDAFFVLRECRELFQRRLVELVGRAGFIRPEALEAFASEVGAAHDELVAAVEKDGFKETAGLTASRISLVGHDELELDIRIAHIIHQLSGDQSIDPWRVQLRYMTLLDRPAMAPEKNPLGLEPISRGLLAICRSSGANLQDNLDLLTAIAEALRMQLANVYVEVNAALEGHGIIPAAVHIVQRPNSKTRGHGSRSGGGYGSGGGGGGDSDGGGRASGYDEGDAGAGNGAGVYAGNAPSLLLRAMHQRFGGNEFFSGPGSGASVPGETGAVALSTPARVMLNLLLERLCAIELRDISRIDRAEGEAGQVAPLRALRATDIDLPLGKPAAIALDTLSLIFDVIFAMPDLPDAIKATIGRLQLPLLRLALLDSTFFADKQHPARRLVCAMARAAVGLGPDTGRDHPISVRLWEVADAVRGSLETNVSDLTVYLETVDTLIAERDESMQSGAQPYLQLIIEHEAQAALRFRTHEWLRKTLAKTTRQELERFVSDYWLRVMQAAYLDGGTAGVRWQECDAAIDLLLSSVQPQPSAAERNKLVTRIPALLKRINAELDSLNISVQERAPFLNRCFELQTAALRKPLDAPDLAERKKAEQLIAPIPFIDLRTPAVSAAAGDQVLERDGKLVQYFGQPEKTPSPWRDELAWKDGDWIRFALPDGESLCGRHCGQISPSGTVVLFNAEWGYAAALSPAELEDQFTDGRARVVSESSLFDDAAERALEQIKPH